MNLVKLEFAFTLELWFSETLDSKNKSFLAIMEKVEVFCFTVSVETAYVFGFWERILTDLF